MICKQVWLSQGSPQGRLSLLVRGGVIVLGSSRWPSFPDPKELSQPSDSTVLVSLSFYDRPLRKGNMRICIELTSPSVHSDFLNF